MINVTAVTVKNFMSVGNQTQAVQFDKSQLTLVLGQNLDLGGDDVGAADVAPEDLGIRGIAAAPGVRDSHPLTTTLRIKPPCESAAFATVTTLHLSLSHTHMLRLRAGPFLLPCSSSSHHGDSEDAIPDEYQRAPRRRVRSLRQMGKDAAAAT